MDGRRILRNITFLLVIFHEVARQFARYIPIIIHHGMVTSFHHHPLNKFTNISDDFAFKASPLGHFLNVILIDISFSCIPSMSIHLVDIGIWDRPVLKIVSFIAFMWGLIYQNNWIMFMCRMYLYALTLWLLYMCPSRVVPLWLVYMTVWLYLHMITIQTYSTSIAKCPTVCPNSSHQTQGTFIDVVCIVFY